MHRQRELQPRHEIELLQTAARTGSLVRVRVDVSTLPAVVVQTRQKRVNAVTSGWVGTISDSTRSRWFHANYVREQTLTTRL